MEETRQNASDAPVLCGVCKAFYGGASTNFLCSKCFKESQSGSRQATETASAAVTTAEPAASASQQLSQPSVQIPAQIVQPAAAASQPAAESAPQEEEKAAPVKEEPKVSPLPLI